MKITFKLIGLIFLLIISLNTNAQKILFVGNSLTYSNNLPKILEYIAKTQDISISSKSLCFPNYAIIDHLNEGKLQRILKKEKFDYLVVQQGPSSQNEGKRMLVEDGEKLKKLCDAFNIKFVYFMVWTSKKWYHTFDLVIENHTIAAQKNEALLFPVGKVWQTYYTHKNIEELYTVDGFHPSKAGSFLAALTMFHYLYPQKNIQQIPHKKWVRDKDSFDLMVRLILKN